MNWRRALLLAGIHVAIALSLILSIESRDAVYVRDLAAYVPAPSSSNPSKLTPAEVSNVKGDAAYFDPCRMIDGQSTQERVLFSAEIPAAALVGWRLPCPGRWTLTGLLHASVWVSTSSSLILQKKIDTVLLSLIALQWFFFGAFPMKGPRRWREPGMLITICSALATATVFIPQTESLAGIPVLFAIATWLLWLGLLAWRTLCATWKRIVNSPAVNAT